MTGAFNNMNKGNVLIYFLYIHLMFYKKKMIESLESRLSNFTCCSNEKVDSVTLFVTETTIFDSK